MVSHFLPSSSMLALFILLFIINFENSLQISPAVISIVDNSTVDWDIRDSLQGTNQTGLNTWYFSWSSTNFFFGLADSIYLDPDNNNIDYNYNYLTIYFDTDPQVDPKTGKNSVAICLQAYNTTGSGVPIGIDASLAIIDLPFNADRVIVCHVTVPITCEIRYHDSTEWVPLASIVNATYTKWLIEGTVSLSDLGITSRAYICATLQLDGLKKFVYLVPSKLN